MTIDPTQIRAVPASGTPVRRKRPRTLYLGLSAVMTAFVVWGFWASYFGPLAGGGDLVRPMVIHLHAAVYAGWIVLLFIQVGLVLARRKDLHRRLGNWGIGYGALVIVMGLAATLVAPALHVQAGEWTLDRAAAFLILPLGDLVLFSAFFVPASIYRHRHAVHKRLMVLATLALVFPGAARVLSPGSAPFLFLAFWLSPLVAAAIVDRITIGRVHRTYWIGLAVILLAYLRVFAMESEAWLRVGRAVVSSML